MKILGLDVGKRRIGLAISDDLSITAQGLESIECVEPSKDIARIAKIAEENGVSEIVMGLPLNMNGTQSQQTKDVLDFLERLSAAVKIPVKTQDERLTSVQADRAMLEADLSRKKRRALSDMVAAQLILQSYLDSRKRSDNV